MNTHKASNKIIFLTYQIIIKSKYAKKSNANVTARQRRQQTYQNFA